MAHALLAKLREERTLEDRISDDDLPNVPELDPLASAQSRRAANHV